jgi:ribonucleotide reductase alpha subunit
MSNHPKPNFVDNTNSSNSTGLEMCETMYVVKRTGEREEVSFDKCLKRIQKLSKDLKINPIEVSKLIITQIYNDVQTWKLDELAADICAAKTTIHPDYGKLASRIIISNHHKNTSPSYSEVVQQLWDNKDVLGNPCPLVSETLFKTVMENKEKINATLDYEKDFNYDYFGFKTLERAYLIRINGKIIERPQHMLMRVSLSIHRDDLKEAIKSYKTMSEGYFTHATPTLFNMGTRREQASSCFLLTIDDDTIEGIYKTLRDCAKISQFAGGIGLAIHKIRGKGSRIRSTNGTSNGIVPMLRNFNETARYVDQCFTPDTLIYTMNGIKCIEHINITDKVLSSDGTFQNVNLPVRHTHEGKMLAISTYYSNVKVTTEHQIMAIKCSSTRESFSIICNDIDRGLLNAEFHDAQDLAIGDLAVFPIPQYLCDIESLTEDDCRMYGILAASHHYLNENTIILKYVSDIDGKDNIETLKFAASYLNGLGYFIDNSEDNLKAGIEFSITTPKFKFTINQFTRANKFDTQDDTKLYRYIDTPFIHLPINKIKQILFGFLDMLPIILPYMNMNMNMNKCYYFDHFESELVNALNYMLLRCGILGISHKMLHDKENYYISNLKKLRNDLANLDNGNYENATNDNDYFRNGNNIYTPIKSIGEFEYKGIVHDFEIAGLHDYTTVSLGVAHNGGGKRAGSFGIYLEPWHADIEDFLKLRLNTGIEEERARDLFYAIWMPDLFMKRVEADGNWTLMCPDKCPNLYLKYGAEFEALYEQYESEGRGIKQMKARLLWEQILNTQIETGMPYIGYKDAINTKNNQKNLGTIQSSNLCHEICEYTSRDEIAVCNLASLALPKFIEVKDGARFYNYEKLREVVKLVIRNLNKIINYNFYPVKEAETSNRRHLPVGLGVQGLSDTFAMLGFAFDSEEAKELNRTIFENIYFAALESSMEIARKRAKYVREYKRLIKLGSGPNAGELTEDDKARIEELKKTYFIIDEELKLPNQFCGAYSSYMGSPISEGKLQFDLWGVEPSESMRELWTNLRADITKHGVRNSLLVALMPTASTSQILGWTECFEPFTNNIYTRKTLAGTFVVVNKYLINDLIDIGLWNTSMKDKIIMADGSVQEILEIPQNIRDRYKTVWEIKQKTIIDLAADRAPFVCQTQSMNCFVKNPTFKVLNSMHFYGWKKGLKTGIYYLRSQAKSSAQKFSVDLEKSKQENRTQGQETDVHKINDKQESLLKQLAENKDEPEGCLMCSA